MCALCGAFGVADHWSDGSREVAAERQHRLAVANRVLAFYGLALSEWSGRQLLTSRTGGGAVVDNFGALWPAAERLAGRPCDPLDPRVIEAIAGKPAP